MNKILKCILCCSMISYLGIAPETTKASGDLFYDAAEAAIKTLIGVGGGIIGAAVGPIVGGYFVARRPSMSRKAIYLTGVLSVPVGILAGGYFGYKTADWRVRAKTL